ncbi:MAG: aromatic amino acid DMT transporter YddG [Neisseriaceae bacterium]|nr:aromatic amino acid DMT transporter YddG [Neisseriaceae bacterium]
MSHAASKATLYGLIAILLWSTVVGMIRSVSEFFGPLGGAALIYSVGTLCLLLVLGRPRIQSFPKAYVLIGSALFVAYELCLSLSLGYAHNRMQAIEVGMINYLWPCLTLLLMLVLNRQKPRWWLYPGLALSLLGITWILSGDSGWSPQQMAANIISNPLSYGLAFSGALIWAVYCNVTQRLAQGHNGVTLFFGLTALVLWGQYGLSQEAPLHFSLTSSLAVLFAGGAMGSAYGLWNVGILRGNMTLLASASYFTPVLSTFFAALVLRQPLSWPFWQGVLMVTLGSILCWWATRQPPRCAPNATSSPPLSPPS